MRGRRTWHCRALLVKPGAQLAAAAGLAAVARLAAASPSPLVASFAPRLRLQQLRRPFPAVRRAPRCFPSEHAAPVASAFWAAPSPAAHQGLPALLAVGFAPRTSCREAQHTPSPQLEALPLPSCPCPSCPPFSWLLRPQPFRRRTPASLRLATTGLQLCSQGSGQWQHLPKKKEQGPAHSRRAPKRQRCAPRRVTPLRERPP
mmetsp:Transcript_8933/g.31103  ORF Transcript_8933/g.31103 Transcript_8933/m.31103 type:complete len:203 (-) Transcript_8933:104-712(-)